VCDEGRLYGCSQIRSRGHVVDRVVNEDRIELAPQPYGAHVAHEVLAIRVELLADLEHPRREVNQRHLEFLLHVRRVVAATRAELENRFGRIIGGLDEGV